VRAALTIDGATGVIRTRTPLDHETAAGLEFDVVAADGGRPSRSSTVRVSVGVLDVDDEPPRFVEPFYAFQIPENQPAASLRRSNSTSNQMPGLQLGRTWAENQPAGTEVGRVEAVDRDAPPFNRFKYAISDAATVPFAVDADSGRLTTAAES